ncbi:MAG: YHS domain-containing (seleno)protein [Pseudomonadota bacterium]
MALRHAGQLVFAITLVTSVAAQEMAPKSTSGVSLDHGPDLTMCSPDGLAVGGFDVLSYRETGGPVAGDPDITAEYDGQRYRFATATNRARFLEDPQRFVPAYNGFCAITLSFGRVTCPDYSNFKIENDRLLLFEVTGFTNGRTLWNSDSTTFRERADLNYERLLELN